MVSQLRAGSGMTADSPLPSIDALWLEMLNRICTRAAHELKGALNGVSVNLEVVRSRSEKPESLASAVKQYANAAVDQLAAVIAMTDALLSLARPPKEPVELGPVLRRVDALLSPSARADGHRLELDGPIDALGVTSAPGNASRMAIAACLLAATEASTHVACRAAIDNGEVLLRIECRDGATLVLDQDMLAATSDSGIRMRAEPSAISISFPSSPSARAKRGI